MGKTIQPDDSHAELIQKDLQDDDKDGVANKFDLEPKHKRRCSR